MATCIKEQPRLNVLPRKIDFLEMEEKWQKIWEEQKTYKYNWETDPRPRYSIDTPPPYPSGSFHMGNVLNWTYFDIRARYKRMQGYNVHFPQGWDCHGLPTEVAVEKAKGIRKSDIPPDQFRKLCEEWIEQYIAIMKKAINRLGCSIDWTLEYRTMEPDYMRKVQLSFLKLHQKNMIYKGEHPINWCPRCETAIADAEVERQARTGKIYTIKFQSETEERQIATTRPEYIPACVAVGVNPEDQRFKHLIGKEATTPIFNKKVPIIADEEVDPKFGTGTMMICTYGDKADVVAVARYKLPSIKLIDGKGIMTENTGKYRGLTIKEARKQIIKDLDEADLIVKTEDLQQEVGECWRCHTNVEIITTDQWFMKTMDLTDKVVEQAKAIDWYPDWMRHRLIDWATSLDWDWVLSRQRVFATPIPAWYCKNCGYTRLALPEELPVDPRVDNINHTCPECSSTDWKGETDVLDTWFDSSLTCAIHAGWPDREDWTNLFPASIHPSGQDIIRTWAYYLMVRSLALFNQPAYNSVLINGMVLGGDGRKMSKSLNNFVATPEVFGKNGADASRQWAATGGSTGTDIPFRWADVEYGWRFMRKLWNASRFASMKLEDYKGENAEPELIDKWLLSKLEKVVQYATDEMEECRFMNATDSARNFVWHIFCDHYLEAIKHRLYSENKADQQSAQRTLNYAMKRMLQLLAPVMPHLTEEIYSHMYSKGTHDSIHTSKWPQVKTEYMDDETENKGDLIIAIISDIRKEKNRQGMSLNKPIELLKIYTTNPIETNWIKEGLTDIAATIKATEIQLLSTDEGTCEIENYPNIKIDF